MPKISPKAIYYSTVFLTGAGVLIFEVAAVRLLAPYFGASLYVLSSVLSVILAALSLGYYFGGRLADRMPHFLPLYFILGSAGLLMLLLLLSSQYLLPVAAPIMSVTSGPLILSLLFFLTPAFLLGIDSPFVIRILSEETADLKVQGAIVGSVFFYSTVGSIIGSIAAGFWLIPTFGLNLTIGGTAVAVTLWSCVAGSWLYWHQPKTSSPLSSSGIVMSVTAAVLIMGGLSHQIYAFELESQTTETIYKSEGLYSSIHIFDREVNGTQFRFLKRDVNNSSAIIPGDTKLVFNYSQSLNLAHSLIEKPANFLMLGGGAYTIPRYLHDRYPDMQIDVVELEPELFPLAQTYFELPITEKITNHVVDGRVFLNHSSADYDIIFSDLFSSGYFIPPHLATLEFYESMKEDLAPNGVGLINIIGRLYSDEINLTDSLIKTVAAIFPNYLLFAMQDPDSEKQQNIMMIVRHEGQPIEIKDESIYDNFAGQQRYLRDLAVNDYIPNADSPIITDDKNPSEALLAKQIKGR